MEGVTGGKGGKGKQWKMRKWKTYEVSIKFDAYDPIQHRRNVHSVLQPFRSILSPEPSGRIVTDDNKQVHNNL